MAERDGTLGCLLAGLIGSLLIYSCNMRGVNPGASEATAPAPVAEDPIKVAACDRFVQAGWQDGVIAAASGHRIEVNEIRWAALPFHTKKSLLEAVICQQTRGRPATPDDTAAAYSYQSGKRLLMLTGHGLTID